MNFNEIESQVAILIEELEGLATEVGERRAREVQERVLRGEAVFVRPAKIRALVYERFELYNHFEARKFTRKFATNAKKLEYYVTSIVNKVCEFFKQYGYHRKPLPKELIERVVDYYANVVIANRRIYVITKRRKVRAPKAVRPSAREGLGHEVQGREVEGLGQTEAREGE